MSQGSLLFPTTGTLSGLALVTALNAALDALVTNATGGVRQRTRNRAFRKRGRSGSTQRPTRASRRSMMAGRG